MNLRLTLTAGAAVILASLSLYPLIQNGSWFWAGIGAVIAIVVAGIITRAPVLYAAVAGSVLALIAVVPLLADGSWPLKVVGLAIVAVTATSRPRWRLLQVLSCLITYLAALLVYLNVLVAAPQSVLGVIPTGASLSRLWSLVGQGMDARALAPPVPGTTGVMLLAAGGIGLIAMLADVLAVRLRSPAMAGLPLLALYCVRITTEARQGGAGAALVFSLGVIGYLALLAADGRERLRIWGRLVTAWGTESREAAEPDAVDTRSLSAAGRRIGVAAACVALVLPLLLPGIGLHDLLHSDSQGPGPGGQSGGSVSLPNPLVQMRDQLLADSSQEVLTYTTTAPNPREQYLQIYALNYDPASGSWILLPPGASTQVGSRPLARVPGLAASTPATHPQTQVTLSQSVTGYGSKFDFLPLPYAPSTLKLSTGTWQEDNSTLMVYSADSALSGLSYTVTSTEAAPESAQLAETGAYPASIADTYLGFTAGPNGELAKLARQITKGASTPYQEAEKLQSYFTSGAFTYNVNVTLPNSIAGLTEFLFSTKSGFCQQFAFAMAALARLVGIPSRIAVGYTAGSKSGKDTWKVTTADAHAWPELYFTGVGWLRFEPTPGGPGGQGTADAPVYAPGAVTGTGVAPPSAGTGAGAKSGLAGGIGSLAGVRPPNGGEVTNPAAAGHGQSIVGWVLLAIAVVLAAALITPLTVRALVRRRRMRTTGDAALAHAAWREFRDSLADYGLGCRASETPRAVARRLAGTLRLDPAAGQAVSRIAGAEERARYAAAPLGAATLRADTAEVRHALSREAGWLARCRASLLPRSTLTPLRETLQHALDVFGWMDAAGLKLRGSIRQQE
jgi:transglutaminase-like putative cysteine protease